MEDPKIRDLCGTWYKDLSRCDSMESAFKAVSLPWLYRLAVRFLNTLRIEIEGDTLSVIVKAGGIMDVVETYPMSGECTIQKRRDKRTGSVIGDLRVEDGRLIVSVYWDEPHKGSATDEFKLDGEALVQTSKMIMKDSELNCSYKTVYTRNRACVRRIERRIT